MFKAYAGIRRVGWYCAILVLAVLELKGGCANMGGCAVTRGCTRLGLLWWPGGNNNIEAYAC